MIYKIKLLLFTVLIVITGSLGGECKLVLGSPSVSPKPMDYLGDGNISFFMANQSDVDIPTTDSLGDPSCTFDIVLSKIAPKNLDLSLVTGTINTYFDLAWDAVSQNILLTQKTDIPAHTEFTVMMPMDVIGQSGAGNPLNGFGMYDTTGTLRIYEYTFTNPATLVALDDSQPGIDGTTGGVAIANVTANDTINGTAMTLGTDVNITSISNTTPLVINQTTGEVSVPAGTATDTYNATYTICEIYDTQTGVPTNCKTANISVIVTESANNLPDYEMALSISGGIYINNPGSLGVLIRITEELNGTNTGDVVLSIGKNSKMILAFDSSLSSMMGQNISNPDWEWTETASTYQAKYIGTETIYPKFTRIYLGLTGVFTPPSSAKGKFPLKVKLRNGSGDTNPANDEDVEVISYSNDN